MQLFLNGLFASVSTMLVVVGLTLMFSIMNIVYLVYGSIIVMAGYAVWYFHMILHWNYLAAAVAAIALVIVIAMALERIVYRRYRGFLLPCLVVSIGLELLIGTAILLGIDKAGYGMGEKVVTPFVHGTVTIVGATMPWDRIIIICAGLLVLIVGYLFLQKSQTGKSMRAVAQEPSTASVIGISLNKMTAVVMIIAGFLAGLYGVLTVSTAPLTTMAGIAPIMGAFLVVIVGGAGSISGAILASFLMGFAGSMASSLVSGYVGTIATNGIAFLVLLLRPQGFFGYHIHVE